MFTVRLTARCDDDVRIIKGEVTACSFVLFLNTDLSRIRFRREVTAVIRRLIAQRGPVAVLKIPKAQKKITKRLERTKKVRQRRYRLRSLVTKSSTLV